jgi:multifunctional methyltransferase subunit TRM112
MHSGEDHCRVQANQPANQQHPNHPTTKLTKPHRHRSHIQSKLVNQSNADATTLRSHPSHLHLHLHTQIPTALLYKQTDTMRLLTHNLLQCNKKGVTRGYPLGISAEAVEVRETEFNGEFLVHMLAKLNWKAFVQAANALKVGEGLPEALTPEHAQDEAFLKLLHHALLEVTVVTGELTCPESGRKFPINKGIPNMMLNEDEV